jgi:hypothetical protein
VTWTRVRFTDQQIAAGEGYRLHRDFIRLCADVDRRDGLAMFSTAFLPGQPSAVFFSPAVSERFPQFTAKVGAQACEQPEASVAVWVGEIDARQMLAH